MLHDNTIMTQNKSEKRKKKKVSITRANNRKCTDMSVKIIKSNKQTDYGWKN